MTKYFHILRLLFRTFGFNGKFLALPLYRFFYSAFTTTTLCLDNIFFPGYKSVKLKRPVFILGHPRSGTTFLHRFLLQHFSELNSPPLWEMVFPSLTARKIVRPFLPILKKISPEKMYDPKIHKTDLFSAETDDAMIFLQFFDGLFYWLFFRAWEQYDSPATLKDGLLEVSHKENHVDFLESVHQRSTYRSGKRMLSKSFSLIMQYEYLREKFPDACFLFLIRDPLEAVPSSMSLVRNVQSGIHDFSKLDETLKTNFYQNLYAASLLFYETFDKIYQDYKDQDNIHLITYPQLLNNFEHEMSQIISVAGLSSSAQIDQAIQAQALKQSGYKGKHRYSCQDFGLDQEKLKRDFSFVYKNYEMIKR